MTKEINSEKLLSIFSCLLPPAAWHKSVRGSADLSRMDDALSNNKRILHELDPHHRRQGNRRNPIFLHGPSRSGKTSMLRVIEDYLGRIRQAKVVRLDAEDLAIELLKSIRNTGDTEAFYHQFFGYDAILVDNIWVLQSKPRTTKEILTFFETLVDRGRLLVIVWDFAPEILLEGTKEIKKLQERSVIVKMKPYRPSCQLGNGIRRG